jgi:Mg2+ and Co2+ transporter CorA
MLKVCSSNRYFYKFASIKSLNTAYRSLIEKLYFIILDKQNSLMKIFTSILVLLALALIVFNITLLDFKNPLEGDSMVAFIGIAASFCAVLILLIFRISKKIEEKTNDR